ncbi:MAG: SMC-Scp complex subunit ScpB [Bdellovibrio sp.]|nr:SMC-Scp complex subunit ScpB [Bdellovibrio sp.]
MAKNKKITELINDVETEASLFLTDETESVGFLPDIIDEASEESSSEMTAEADIEGTELDGFESAQIEELEFVEDEQAESIIESILFASDRPVSLASIQMVFKGTNVKKEKIRRVIESLAVEYAGGRRGVVLEEVTGGYQIRTKVDNMNFLKRTVKTRAFKLSGPALETLAIVAYKQPTVKLEIDQIRGVESGHLLRALMEKGLVNFEGKAENLPGKPMQYGTTRRFLEIFGLRNLKELPTLSQIDELLPEGIGEEEEEKPTLSMVTDSMSEEIKIDSYSQGEEELGLIEEQLTSISTSSEFFEQEKIRQKMKRDEEKAQDIREALAVGEEVPKRDQNWLKKHEEALVLAAMPAVISSLEAPSTSEEASEFSALEETDSEEDAPHIEDEIPFYEEADEEEPSEEGYV